MPDHPSTVVILAEDQEHQNLVWHYLRNCAPHRDRMGRVRKVALPGNRGCGSQYVREQFPAQVAACRGRQANSLLIVITDADNLGVEERERTLHNELIQAGGDAVQDEEPIVVLVPKWQVETWIKCLMGQAVREDDPHTDRPAVTGEDVKAASETLHGWARPNAQIGAKCVASLRMALPRWLRIG